MTQPAPNDTPASALCRVILSACKCRARHELRWQWRALWRYALCCAVPITALSFYNERAAIYATLTCGVWRGLYLGWREWKRP